MAKPSPIPGLAENTPVNEAARHALPRRLADVRAYEDRVLGPADGHDVDAVHDMRVAARRLRAAIAMFRPEVRATELVDRVKHLRDALGAVRDVDVQLAWLKEVLASPGICEPERPGIVRLLTDKRDELPPRREALKEALELWVNSIAPELEDAFAKSSGRGRLGGRRMRRRLRRRLKRLGRRMKPLWEPNSKGGGSASPDVAPHDAHLLRIDAKKLRYEAELLEDAVPGAPAAILEALAPLQEALGELHDCDMRLPVVERFLARTTPLEQPGGVALLRHSLKERDIRAAELGSVLGYWRRERLTGSLRRLLG